MTHVNDDRESAAGCSPNLPHPTTGSRWRWASSRRAVVGSGVSAVVLSLDSATAGAPVDGASPLSRGQRGTAQTGMPHPTTAGQITSLSGDTATIQALDKASRSITYSSSTTFRTMSGTSSAAVLRVGDFIAVMGTKKRDGSVAATSVMIGMSSHGNMGNGGSARPGATPCRKPLERSHS